MRKGKFGILTFISVSILLLLLLFSNTNISVKLGISIDSKETNYILETKNKIKDGELLIAIYNMDMYKFNQLLDLIYDDPEIYWIDLDYSAFSIGKLSIAKFKSKYDNIQIIENELNKTADRILERIIKDDMSDYDKCIAVHDWICKNVTYMTTPDDSDQDIYGALLENRAVCAGYAKTFAFLLRKLNISCDVISGESMNKQGEMVSHAWNKVILDGNVCYFDVTWDDDDLNNTYHHDWCGVNSESIRVSHKNNDVYPYENSLSTKYDYYIRNGMYLEKYSAVGVANQIKKQGKTFNIKFSNGTELYNAKKALENKEEIQKIMRAANISYIDSIKYSANEYSKCLHVTIQ